MIDRSRKGRGKKAPRPTKYGNPTQQEGVAMSTNDALSPLNGKDSWKKTYPKFDPVSDEVTVYGAKKFRTPYRKDQFVGTTGTRQKAVILDIDGTLQGWGSSADSKVMKWVKKQYDLGYVLIVITARDEGMQDTSFNWLMHHLPFPFVGPITRSVTDPRYASEFKRETCEHLEGIYQIMGAADDNKFVNDMWKQWAKDHFEVPEDFDLLECDTYASYGTYRSGLPSKGASLYDKHYGAPAPTSYSKGSYSSGYDTHKGQHWVTAHSDPVTGNWVSGHWEKDLVVTHPTSPPALTSGGGKHRPAGQTRWEMNDEPASVGKVIDIGDDPRWAYYFAQGKKNGRYLAPDFTEPEIIDAEVIPSLDFDDLIDDLDDEHSLRRSDMITTVAHEYPHYTEAEIKEMTNEELRDLVGITGDDYVDDSEPLFDDWQLSLDGQVDPLDRERLIIERLELENELYAKDLDLTRLQITNMDYDDLVERLDVLVAEARAKAEAES